MWIVKRVKIKTGLVRKFYKLHHSWWKPCSHSFTERFWKYFLFFSVYLKELTIHILPSCCQIIVRYLIKSVSTGLAHFKYWPSSQTRKMTSSSLHPSAWKLNSSSSKNVCVHACVRACLRACVGVWVCVCVCVCVYVRELLNHVLLLSCPPGSSIHGILMARILEWVAIPFSRGSS